MTPRGLNPAAAPATGRRASPKEVPCQGNGCGDGGDPGGGDNDSDAPRWRRALRCLVKFYWDNEFLLLVVAAICLAKAYPPLPAVYLAPAITASWIAVAFIFLLSGLNLKTTEFHYAFKQVYFNAFVEVYNFFVVSAIVYGVSRGLAQAGILTQGLADGLLICSCLSASINIGIVLTKAAHGDEAAAIFHAAFGNLVGVFLSPTLILMYLKEWSDVALGEIFYKLCLKVLLPIAVGQILQRTCQAVVDFIERYKKYFGKAQQYALVFIIYTTFGKTFMTGLGASIASILYLILFIFLLLVVLMIVAWLALKLLFRDKPKLRVMGLFGCTHKTIAIGVPLINAIYENNPSVGLYTLPLIIWYPMQLMLGTFLVPRLQVFIKNETARLQGTEADEFEEDDLDDDEADSDDADADAAERGQRAAATSGGGGSGPDRSEAQDSDAINVSISDLEARAIAEASSDERTEDAEK